MALTIDYPKGATRLDPDEAQGLLPSGISTRGQLDELEAANILEAVEWASGRQRELLSPQYAQELHRRMFHKVWNWAGGYRTSQKNIGIAAHDIPAAMRDLFEDVRIQIAAGELSHQEVALRFHHRLTRIHPFANGNGRHARFLTDLLLQHLGAEPFEWGAGDLTGDGNPRSAYIDALHSADDRDYAALRRFLGAPEEASSKK